MVEHGGSHVAISIASLLAYLKVNALFSLLSKYKFNSEILKHANE